MERTIGIFSVLSRGSVMKRARTPLPNGRRAEGEGLKFGRSLMIQRFAGTSHAWRPPFAEFLLSAVAVGGSLHPASAAQSLSPHPNFRPSSPALLPFGRRGEARPSKKKPRSCDRGSHSHKGFVDQKSIPPPPMPPPGMPPPASFFGSSAIMASVVIRRPATEAASWIAVRTTLVGSMMPALTMST